MALDEKNHPEMIKDKTLVQFLAYSLDHSDPEVVEISLKTIELLVRNPKNYGVLRTTFGVTESLKATTQRDDLDNSLLNLAKDICSDLQSPPTAYCSMSRSTSKPEVTKKKFSSKVYSLHVFGLNQYTKNDLESALIRIRGVISVVLDVEHQRCTVRAVEKVTPEAIINHISTKTKLQARLVVKNKLNQEMLVAASEDNTDTVDERYLPEYLPEEEPIVKEKALHPFQRIKASAAEIINTASSFLQNSFYW